MSITRDEAKVVLRRRFEFELEAMSTRYQRAKLHRFIPAGFFSAGSRECRDLYVSGNFYGAIVLTQAVAEGLGKFLADKNGLPMKDDPRAQASALRHRPNGALVSETAWKAFARIRGAPAEDRNDFHHFNPSVPQATATLEARALECIDALYKIESEVFAVDMSSPGTVRPVHGQYWEYLDGQSVLVNFRAE